MTKKGGKMKSKLPKWFKGQHYDSGAEVKNPFSGESYKLDSAELSMYDFIMGAQIMIGENWLEDKNQDLAKNIADGITWFRRKNPKAYMVLLD